MSLWLAAVMVLVALVATACGSSKSSSSNTNSSTASSGTTSNTVNEGRTYSTLRVTWDQPDYMDPGLAYTVAAWQIMWNVYGGLLGYKHANGASGATLVPYLAQSLPKITNGGKTYTFMLRQGLKYSNGKPVKASDFPYTIERDFKMDSPGVGFFSVIKGVSGASGYATTKKGHISGITANDATGKITITLDHPEADFANILATEFAAFVPAGTPATDQSAKGGPPADGPYMVSAYNATRSFTIVRNPQFQASKMPDVPRGNPDKVVGKIITDPTAAMETVLNGQSDYDFQPIPNDRLATIQKQHGAQLKIYTPADMYYIFLNNRIAPFNNIKARQAVEYGLNRQAMVQFFGGLAQPTQNLLPPNYPQYKKISKYTYNLAKAKSLAQASGTTGQSVTVYGVNTDPSKSIVEYVASQLTKMGWKATVKLLAHGVYFTTIGNQATKAQAGYADWYQDYPNPIDWFDVLFNGDRITQTHNNNYGNVDFPDVNKMINKLKATPTTTPAQNGAWAKVDSDLVVKYASTVPYVNRSGTDFFSPKMDMSCYQFHVLYQWDFATSCQK
ncbi:MAG TPA: ABC transporter substrate-binding protein [Polyangiaceae bacterium]|nr:ABC transporter substrate-binding protein [Polyangiaceae bacterium]